MVSNKATLLLLDGSLGEACVALLRLEGETPGIITVAAPTEIHQRILPRVAALLPDAAARSQLTAVLVGVGPGSYTGLRAAASAAAGIAAALGIPIIQVPSDRALVAARDAVAARDGVERAAPVVLSLGTREVLIADAEGARVAPRDGAPIGADLSHIAAALPAALASIGSTAISALRLSGGVGGSAPLDREIALRYPAPPRGTNGGGL